MRKNLYLIQSTHLKCTIECVYMFRVINPSPQPDLRHFHHPKRKPCTPELSLSNRSIPPNPRQALLYFLFQWICLFWVFGINGNHIRCCPSWLVSFTLHNVFKVYPYWSMYFFLSPNNIALHDIWRLYLCSSWWVVGLFPLFGY